MFVYHVQVCYDEAVKCHYVVHATMSKAGALLQNPLQVTCDEIKRPAAAEEDTAPPQEDTAAVQETTATKPKPTKGEITLCDKLRDSASSVNIQPLVKVNFLEH